jgi:hypothetical protein
MRAVLNELRAMLAYGEGGKMKVRAAFAVLVTSGLAAGCAGGGSGDLGRTLWLVSGGIVAEALNQAYAGCGAASCTPPQSAPQYSPPPAFTAWSEFPRNTFFGASAVSTQNQYETQRDAAGAPYVIRTVESLGTADGAVATIRYDQTTPVYIQSPQGSVW